MKSTVYMPSLPFRTDKVSGRRFPAIDITPAEAWGTPRLVLERLSQDRAADIRAVQDAISRSGPQDYIMAAGDTLLVAAAIITQVQTHGQARVLSWDRKERVYTLAEAVM